MKTIRLCHRGLLATDDDGQSVALPDIASGAWRIVRCDRWEHNERVVDALRQLAERVGVELIDPTGLLGGSRSGGRDTDRESYRPVGRTQRGGDRSRVTRRPSSIGTQV